MTTLGAPEGSFGAGGVATSGGASGELRVGRALALAQDGTLAVSGVRVFDSSSPVELLTVWRFNANGSPLSSFNGDGFVSYRFPDGLAAGTDVAFDSSNRVLVVGVTRATEEKNGSATLWRFSSSGALDSNLPGSDGKGVERFDERPKNVSTSAGSIVIGSGGVFAVGGAVDHNTDAVDLLVWKLLP